MTDFPLSIPKETSRLSHSKRYSACDIFKLNPTPMCTFLFEQDFEICIRSFFVCILVDLLLKQA
jgi:hypothetical protein